jgi:hypothetical protein
LSPSEKVWSKRCEFLFQKGYQLRPRYQPKWNATFRGNGTHPTSAEDHIMQIVSVCHSSFIMSVNHLIASASPRCNSSSGWPCGLSQVNPGSPKHASNSNSRPFLDQTHDKRHAEPCCPHLRFFS